MENDLIYQRIEGKAADYAGELGADICRAIYKGHRKKRILEAAFDKYGQDYPEFEIRNKYKIIEAMIKQSARSAAKQKLAAVRFVQRDDPPFPGLHGLKQVCEIELNDIIKA